MAKDTNEFRVIGPPGCISGDAIVKTNRATLTRPYRLDYIVDRINSAVPGGFFAGGGYAGKPVTKWDSDFTTFTRSDVDGIIRLQPVLAAYERGVKQCVRVTTSSGKSLSLTPDHNLFSYGSVVAAGSLKIGDAISVDGGRPVKTRTPRKANYLTYEGLKFHPLCGRKKQRRFCICKHRAVVEAAMNNIGIEQYLREFRTGQFARDRKTLTREQIVHHKNADTYDNRIENLEVIENQKEHSRLHGIEGRWKDVTSKIAHEEVVSIEDAGELPTFDITVGHPSGHGNFLANGILCENCGKSTYLADQVVKRSQAWSIANEKPINQCTDVLLASLTKTAAAELRGRGLDLPAGQIGTLHSHALRALGSPKLCVGAKAISQWNKESPLEHWMSGGSTGDDELSVGLAQYNGDRLMSEYTTNRCRLTPRDEWRGPVMEFADRYESWKRLNNMMDYEDLITNAFEHQTDPPGNPSTILGDEQQDSSAADLRLMRYWGSKAQKLILVGDEDQCQPAGTMVSVEGGGKVAIENLDQSSDRLVTYCTNACKLIGLRSAGKKFEKSSRSYSGRMYSVSTASGKSTKATSNHKWLVRDKRDVVAWVVYGMQQGDRFRIGWCKARSNKHSTNHFNIRCRCENADYGWVLKVFDNDIDASAYEKVVAVRYGLPLVCFKDNANVMVGLIEKFFGQMDAGDQRRRFTSCLSEHGREIEFPYYKKNPEKKFQSSRRRLTVESPNLIPELMSIPEVVTQGESETQWTDFSTSHHNVCDETVYSLEVEKHHNYVANGIVTHNCIFNFRGADSGGISRDPLPPDHEKVLEQSYRVPRAVHAAAMDVIRRIENRKDVVYYPRDANGQVDRMHYSMRQNPYEVVDEIERLLKEPDEKPGTAKAMCLFSCAYQAQPLMYALKSAGIPFWNPYAVERSNFNPLHPSKGVSTLERVLAYLRNSEACHGEQAATWTWEQFAAWAEMCSADGWLRHGAKTEIKKRASVAASLTMTVEEIEGLISNEDVMLDLAECDLGWLGKHILEPKRGVYDYVVDIVKKLGYTGITEQPRVVIGTGHSVKGGEAEHVFVCPDLSVSGWESYGNFDTRDSIYRLYYVMLTRARQRLILTAPSCPQAVML